MGYELRCNLHNATRINKHIHHSTELYPTIRLPCLAIEKTIGRKNSPPTNIITCGILKCGVCSPWQTSPEWNLCGKALKLETSSTSSSREWSSAWQVVPTGHLEVWLDVFHPLASHPRSCLAARVGFATTPQSSVGLQSHYWKYTMECPASETPTRVTPPCFGHTHIFKASNLRHVYPLVMTNSLLLKIAHL